MKKITFFLVSFLFALSSTLSAQNLLAGWEGNGVTGTLSKPNDVGWLNTVSASIPWNTANSGSGCRFRDSGVSGGYTAGSYTIEGGGTLTTRMLMLRYDNSAYSSSVYAYKVTLEACATYTFSWDYVCGGSGTPPKNITVGISTTANSTGRLSSKTFTTTSSTTIFRSGTYTFTTGATAGDYFITINGEAVWYGIANLSLVKSNEQSLSLSKQYAFFDNSPDGLTETFLVQGSSLSESVNLTAPAGISLNPNTISATDAQCGVTVTAIYNNSVNIRNGSIDISSGTFSKTILVDAVKNNLVGSWDADGSVDPDASIPTANGWSSTGTITWIAANQTTAGTLRYVDAPANYTYSGNPYKGRILYLRWDASNSLKTQAVYSIPVTLEGSKFYEFRGKAAFNSNATAPTIKINICTTADNTGEVIASDSIITSTAMTLIDSSFTFKCPTTGTYFINFTANTESLNAIADLSITQVPGINATLNDEANQRLRFTNPGEVQNITVTTSEFSNGLTVTSDNPLFEVLTPTLPSTGGTVSVKFMGTTKGVYEGNLTIASENTASPIPGLKKISGAGTSLNIVMVADVETGVNNLRLKNTNIFISDNQIISQINLIQTSIVEIAVFNVNGMLIASEKQMLNAGANQLVLNTNISNGVYFVKLNIDGDVTTTKLVK